MKKNIILSMVLCCTLLCFAGCQSGGAATATPTQTVTNTSTLKVDPTPTSATDIEATLDAAAVKTAALTAVDMTTDMSMTMTVDGSEIAVKSGIAVKCADINAENPEASISTTANIFGIDVYNSVYFDNDGIMYVDDSLSKTKTPGTLFNSEYFSKEDLDLPNPPASVISSKCTISPSNGGYIISGDFSSDDLEQMESYLNELLESMQLSKESCSFDSLSFKYIIDSNGYIANLTVSMKLSVIQDGQTVSADAVMTIEYNNPGQAVTVTPPTDLDQYVSDDEA